MLADARSAPGLPSPSPRGDLLSVICRREGDPPSEPTLNGVLLVGEEVHQPGQELGEGTRAPNVPPSTATPYSWLSHLELDLKPPWQFLDGQKIVPTLPS